MDEHTFKKLLNQALDPIKKDLNDLKDVVENRILPSVTEIEVTLKSYADRYKINQLNIERVDIRLTVVEDNLGIQHSEDLKVPHFSPK